MMKKTLLVLLFICASIAPLHAKTLTRIAAVVNNEIITTHELDQAVTEELSSNSQSQLTAGEFDSLKAQTLDTLINNTLMQQRIKELDLSVSEQELATAIEDVRSKNNLTAAELVQALATQGMTMDSYRARIRKDILRYKLMGREVNSKVVVTSSEVREYFRDHISDYKIEPTISLKHIIYTIPKNVTAEQLDDLKQQADADRRKLLAGKDFAEVAAAHSDIAEGRDMGQLLEKDLAPQLQDLLAGLKAGDVSEAVIFNDNLHTFQVVARSNGEEEVFEQARGEIESRLREEKIEQRYQQWQQEIRANAHIDIRI